METSGVSSGSGVTVAARGDLGGITGMDFLNVLVKQLQMQDPFEPMTNEEMVSQISTIRELEMNTRLSTRLEQLTDQQRFGGASALIGRHVKGVVYDPSGNGYEMEGIVTGVRFTERGETMLELDTGEFMPLSALQAVSAPEV